jgi:N-methylhydantoinase A
MKTHVFATLAADGVAQSEIEVRFQIDVRYHGQAFEVPMLVQLQGFEERGLSKLAAAFDEEHRRLFTFNMDAEHELVNLRAVALGKALELPSHEIAGGNGDPIAAKLRDHEVWMDGGLKPAVIYDRAKLRAGDKIPGPAVVIEMDATTLILSGCVGTVDPFGNILILPV